MAVSAKEPSALDNEIKPNSVRAIADFICNAHGEGADVFFGILLNVSESNIHIGTQIIRHRASEVRIFGFEEAFLASHREVRALSVAESKDIS